MLRNLHSSPLPGCTGAEQRAVSDVLGCEHVQYAVDVLEDVARASQVVDHRYIPIVPAIRGNGAIDGWYAWISVLEDPPAAMGRGIFSGLVPDRTRAAAAVARSHQRILFDHSIGRFCDVGRVGCGGRLARRNRSAGNYGCDAYYILVRRGPVIAGDDALFSRTQHENQVAGDGREMDGRLRLGEHLLELRAALDLRHVAKVFITEREEIPRDERGRRFLRELRYP